MGSKKHLKRQKNTFTFRIEKINTTQLKSYKPHNKNEEFGDNIPFSGLQNWNYVSRQNRIFDNPSNMNSNDRPVLS